jgi:hypothetical protein
LPDTKTGLLRRDLNTVDQVDSDPGIVGDQQVAVEIDVVAQARDRGTGGDAEPLLDRATEHHAET